MKKVYYLQASKILSLLCHADIQSEQFHGIVLYNLSASKNSDFTQHDSKNYYWEPGVTAHVCIMQPEDFQKRPILYTHADAK